MENSKQKSGAGINSALEILKKEPLQNISTLGFLANQEAEKVYSEGDSLLVLGRSDHLWAYLSSSDAGELARLLQGYGWETGYFASVEDWMVPALAAYGEVEWQLMTYRYYLPAEVEVPPPGREVAALAPEFASYIFQHSDYQAYTSISYIRERLEMGPSAAVMEEGRPIAWGLTHDDDALGFLYVLPARRGLGYGRVITRAMVQKKRAAGKPVFMNIEPHNTPSLQLTEEEGFVRDRKVGWLKLKQAGN